jgi:hypothetical protein
VTLPEVVTGELAGKFGEISLFDHYADFELEPASNSNSTSPWAIACESATQPSHVVPPPHERSTRGPRILSMARKEAPPSRRAGKEPVPEYNLDSDTAPGRASGSNSLRVVLELCIRVRLRVGPRGSRVRGQIYLASLIRASLWTGYNVHTGREIHLLARP